MSEKVKPHTPLPWRREHEYIVSENGIAHASFDYTLDANYIVLACNSYPALLAERDRLRELLVQYRRDLLHPLTPESRERRIKAIDAALKDTNQ